MLSGAGLSTDSGIPDYRGPQGALKKRSPVTYSEFLRSEDDRRRYWARSFIGWPYMNARQPNDGHYLVTALQEAGAIDHIITQNVDGLHQRAGSRKVLELHGAMGRVICLNCGTRQDREEFQRDLARDNPGWPARYGDGSTSSAEPAPDGDAELLRNVTESFTVPGCPACGGVMKPDVVFFGESVPRERVADAFRAVDRGDLLLVLGSSLTVYSGFRFADHAVRNGKALVIINRGPTRADRLATMKVDAPLSSTLSEIASKIR